MSQAIGAQAKPTDNGKRAAWEEARGSASRPAATCTLPSLRSMSKVSTAGPWRKTAEVQGLHDSGDSKSAVEDDFFGSPFQPVDWTSLKVGRVEKQLREVQQDRLETATICTEDAIRGTASEHPDYHSAAGASAEKTLTASTISKQREKEAEEEALETKRRSDLKWERDTRELYAALLRSHSLFWPHQGGGKFLNHFFFRKEEKNPCSQYVRPVLVTSLILPPFLQKVPSSLPDNDSPLNLILLVDFRRNEDKDDASTAQPDAGFVAHKLLELKSHSSCGKKKQNFVSRRARHQFVVNKQGLVRAQLREPFSSLLEDGAPAALDGDANSEAIVSPAIAHDEAAGSMTSGFTIDDVGPSISAMRLLFGGLLYCPQRIYHRCLRWKEGCAADEIETEATSASPQNGPANRHRPKEAHRINKYASISIAFHRACESQAALPGADLITLNLRFYPSLQLFPYAPSCFHLFHSRARFGPHSRVFEKIAQRSILATELSEIFDPKAATASTGTASTGTISTGSASARIVTDTSAADAHYRLEDVAALLHTSFHHSRAQSLFFRAPSYADLSKRRSRLHSLVCLLRGAPSFKRSYEGQERRSHG